MKITYHQMKQKFHFFNVDNIIIDSAEFYTQQSKRQATDMVEKIFLV
jgi:hypothetical protein